ncbi:MAG TPA: hypothetical protein VK935_12650 [Actinomycetospora sp.]|nr:hypothetical protein [Actinomycetospora sp.]
MSVVSAASPGASPAASGLTGDETGAYGVRGANQDGSVAGGVGAVEVRVLAGSARSVPTSVARSWPVGVDGGAVWRGAWSVSRSDGSVMSRPLPVPGAFDAEGRPGVDEVRAAERPVARPVARPQGGVAGRRQGGRVGAGGAASSPGMSAPTARKPCGGVRSASAPGVVPAVGRGPDGGWSAGSGEANGPDGATDEGIGNPPVVGPWGRASGGGGGPTSTSSAEPQPPPWWRRQDPEGGPVTASAVAGSGRSARSASGAAIDGVSAPSDPTAGCSPVWSRGSSPPA